MLDLETFGQRPGSVLVALGAVKFRDGEIIGQFYERIDPESCVRQCLVLDASTVQWWLKQSEPARLELTKPAEDIGSVLAQFESWLGSDDFEVWGCGSDFDNALAAEAWHRVFGTPPPWKFWNNRCYRTLKALFPHITLPREGTHHNALDDAIHQALHAMLILKEIEASRACVVSAVQPLGVDD